MSDNAQDWKQALPEAMRADPGLKDFKDVAGLAKSYTELLAYQGASIRIPSKDASVEQKHDFALKLKDKVPNVVLLPETDEDRAVVEPMLWKALGRPEDAKEYSAEGIELGGIELPMEELQKEALKRGMTKAQFKEQVKSLVEARHAAARAIKDNIEATKKEWGVAYDERMKAIVDTARKLEVPEETLKQIAAGAMPLAQLKVWHKVAAGLGGSGRQAGDQGQDGAKPRKTPLEAQARLAEIHADPDYFLLNQGGRSPNMARHELLKRERDELMPQAYPELVEPG